MGRPSVREKLLSSGIRTVHEIGFTRAGVRDIAAAACVPQGSFTNHFASKEAFGLAVLDRYLDEVEATMSASLDDVSLAPLDRLLAYFEIVAGKLAEAGWRHGCLIGNLSLDVAEHSEPLRERLRAGMDVIVERFTATVREAQISGAMRADLPAAEVAAALMAGWQGAMLWMKTYRDASAIERFRNITLVAFVVAPVVRGDRK